MIKLLLALIIVYLIVKLIQSFKPKIKGQGHRPFGNSSWNGKQQATEGETTIQDSNKSKRKKISKNEGEYIDYEDV